MGGLTSLLKRFLRGRRDAEYSQSDLEELRATFRHRYENFRMLLTCNGRALEIMAEIEQALAGSQPFGMSFVRSKCTAVSVNVYRIIKHLDELAPGKYAELHNRFKVIEGRINEALALKKASPGGPLALPISSINRNMVDQVGGKMASVAELRNELGLRVPPGFVITAEAFQRFLRHNDLQTEIERRIQASPKEGLDHLYSLCAGIHQLIVGSPLPLEVEQAVMEQYRELEKQAGSGVRVSLRSSAVGEDVAGRAFAGQFKSELNVSPDNILHAYKEVVAAKYGLPAVTYRLNRGIPDEDIAMCVGCMAMVDAVAGGVMYSRDPMNIRNRVVLINSVWGLPKAVVDGTVEPDAFEVSRDGGLEITRKEIRVKEREFVCYPDEGVCRMDLTGERSDAPSLTDEQVLQLADMAVRLEEHYGTPQDIEWAVGKDGSIYLLQCRALAQWESTTAPKETERRRTVDAALLASGGTTASPGVGVGPVFVVRSDVDRLRFPEGAVLVTAQALPRWAPLLNRASAVVTEVGGPVGHLANVAREFRVPGLFGLSGATDLLREGEIITVDADGHAVYEGRIESLLAAVDTKRNLMEGSPVLATLERAASHIVPLNLLDPDAPEFHPRKCETLHDITRFSHEKSVKEMFDFGKEHHFSERSSKQLVYRVPMQWWVINLDDGFSRDVQERFVNLEDIVSIPMRALWEGVIAIPWAGPPPVDARGFMSVLVQATANPALDPAMSSPYAQRNYIMLSRNFCALSSRFGFHFSTVEALVSERAAENYVSFNFKGGAADLRRRVLRAALIGGILEEYGFRVEIKGDSVLARLDGGDQGFMESRLMMLGYLIMHTRQIDMVMANDGAFHHFRGKMVQDIAGILERKAPSDSGTRSQK
ncbi:MAG: pyruvate, water dikinase [Desulfomonile sp.]|nr:pyruvate, water dikinase [Desulfomonile sp.]